MEGAPRLWKAELALHGVVVSVQVAPTSFLESVRLGLVFGAVKEWCPRLVFLQDELRVSHEVMDGASGFGFLEAFVQGATERIHHFDLGGVASRGGEKTGVSQAARGQSSREKMKLNDERQPWNEKINRKPKKNQHDHSNKIITEQTARSKMRHLR